MPFGRLTLKKVRNYSESADALSKLIMKGQLSPKIREWAIQIVRDCPNRDDACELTAIFEAVKRGHPTLHGLEGGIAYRSDPQEADYFTGAEYLRGMCERGACAGDCDDHTVMVASLAAAIGHTVGLRIWRKDPNSQYAHIYAVALVSKKLPIAAAKDEANVMALDTSTEEASPGWQPDYGYVKTYWIKSRGG